jgi:hypothetical protein
MGMVRRVTKHAGSFAPPHVGVTERLARGVRRITGFWFRAFDSFPYRWGRFRDRLRFRWYGFVHGAGGAARRTGEAARRHARWFSAAATVLATALVAAALVAAVIATVGGTTERAAPSQATVPSAVPSPGFSAAPSPPVSDDQLPGVHVHVNDQAGYLFSYPDGWKLTRSGTSTTLVDPKDEVQMAFATAPSAPLEETTRRVVDGLTSPYRDVDVVTRDSQVTEQGQSSLVLGGTAVDQTGSTIRFLVVTIEGKARNWAITVRYEPHADVTDSITAIEEIVGSFRTSESS